MGLSWPDLTWLELTWPDLPKLFELIIVHLQFSKYIKIFMSLHHGVRPSERGKKKFIYDVYIYMKQKELANSLIFY